MNGIEKLVQLKVPISSIWHLNLKVVGHFIMHDFLMIQYT